MEEQIITAKKAVLLLILGFLLFNPLATASASGGEECLKFEPEKASVQGILVEKTWSDGKGQLRYWAVEMEKPVCAKSKLYTAAVGGWEVQGVKAVQLSPTFIFDMYKRYRNFLGKKVAITGLLWNGHRPKHRSKLMMSVKSIRPLEDKGLEPEGGFSIDEPLLVETSIEEAEKIEECVRFYSYENFEGVLLDESRKLKPLWIIKLPEPLCVKDILYSSGFAWIRPRIHSLQLQLSEEKYRKYKNLLGKKVFLKGSFSAEAKDDYITQYLLKYIEEITDLNPKDNGNRK